MLEQDRRFAPEVLVSTKKGGRVLAHHDHVFHNSHLGLNVPEESRDLTDFSSRVAHIDASGIVISAADRCQLTPAGKSASDLI